MYENNISSSNVICALLLLFEMRNLSTHIRALAQTTVHTYVGSDVPKKAMQANDCKKNNVSTLRGRCASMCLCVVFVRPNVRDILLFHCCCCLFLTFNVSAHSSEDNMNVFAWTHWCVLSWVNSSKRKGGVNCYPPICVWTSRPPYRVLQERVFSPRVDSCVQKPSHRRSFYLCSVRLSLSCARRL